MNFQLISHVHLFPHQLDILGQQFGGTDHSTFTPSDLEDGGFEILDREIGVVLGTAPVSLGEELVEAGFTVWVPVRDYPRSVTRPWETRTVLAGYAKLA